MKPLADLNDAAVDRLFGGSDLDEVAAFFAELKSALVSPPGSEVAERHVAAMTEAARTTDAASPARGVTVTAGRGRAPWRKILAPAVNLAAVCVGLMSLTAGLAYVGVDLPGQVAEKVFAAIGVELPYQDGRPPTDPSDVAPVVVPQNTPDPRNEKSDKKADRRNDNSARKADRRNDNSARKADRRNDNSARKADRRNDNSARKADRRNDNSARKADRRNDNSVRKAGRRADKPQKDDKKALAGDRARRK